MSRTKSGTVLITGATGFTGSSLVQLYVDAGWRVVGTHVNPTQAATSRYAGAELHHVDLRDAEAVRALVADVRPLLVHHLAAQSSVSTSLRDPMGTLATNSGMQFNVLQAVADHAPAAGVVLVGSSDEYGNVGLDDNPVNESHSLAPVTPYGLSKVVQDLMGIEYVHRHNMRIVRVRPFLQLGPRRAQRFVAGNFARQVAEVALGRRPPHIRTGNIDLKRDFTDVRDVARAMQLLAECGVPGEVYNIASGVPHSLRDLLMAMMTSAGVEAEVLQDAQLFRDGESDLIVGDASRLRALTGWYPTISFEESARDTVEYWHHRLTTERADSWEES